MKEIDLGQTITILANIGVIIGIAFLALEIRQNNRQLAAQTRFAYFQTRINFSLVSATDPIISPILVKLALGEALSPQEEAHIINFAIAALDAWRFEMLEYNAGRLTYEELDIPRKREVYNLPALREAFDRILAGEAWPAEFREFLREHLSESE